MSRLIEAALRVAEDYPVFPTENKRPCWSNAELGVQAGQGGYKMASQDPAQVRKLFSHPKAIEIAVPTGDASGLVCIDVDLYKDPSLDEWMAGRHNLLSGTRCHTTRSGGLHFLFTCEPGMRFPSTLRPGVDIKAQGGYVCWPGTPGYSVDTDNDVLPFPMALLEGIEGHTAATPGSYSYESATDEELIERIKSATELYPSMRTLSYRLAMRHAVPPKEQIRILERACGDSVASNPNHPRHRDWVDRTRKIEDLVRSANDKINAPVFDARAAQELEGVTPLAKEAPPPRPIGPQRQPVSDDLKVRVAVVTKNEKEKPDTADIEEDAALGAKHLMANIVSPISWIVPNMIPVQGIVSLAGNSNVGKTRWIATFLMALAVGDTTRLGLPPCGRRISSLWIANEERFEDIKRRLKAVVLQHGDTDSALIYVRGKGNGALRLVTRNEIGTLEIDLDALASLVLKARRGGCEVIVFDPYVTLSDAPDENDAASAALLSHAFILLASETGCTIIHAHHTPKDRSKDLDWYRGDSSAWRGSGAIYSGLDCGYTLSNWIPRNKEQRKAWKDTYLESGLSRWIVLDTGKIREGAPLKPIVYELVGQQMQPGEGDPIGVCRLSNDREAAGCILQDNLDVLATTELARAIIGALGDGQKSMAEADRLMSGHPAWPSSVSTNSSAKDKLLDMFSEEYTTEDGSVQVTSTQSKGGLVRWFVIVKVV